MILTLLARAVVAVRRTHVERVALPGYAGGYVTDAEFAEHMASVGLEHAQRTSLVVGVSGGPDSLALALLADRWAQRNGSRIVACVIDHAIPVRTRCVGLPF